MPLPNVQADSFGHLAALDGSAAVQPLVLAQQVRALRLWPRRVLVRAPRLLGDQQRRGSHRAGVDRALLVRDFLFEERTGSHGFLLG